MKEKCKQIRKEVLKCGGGHIVSCYSCIEILVALYYGGALRFDTKNPKWEERDRFILSKGHAGKALYCILEDLGFFEKGVKGNFCTHPTADIPGVEITSGSLGNGLGIAAGMAYALKQDKKSPMVFCLMGDGECAEGSVWEAAMFASSHRLDNLIAIIDRNKLGATDFIENSLSLEPLVTKWLSFGWYVDEVDGHDLPKLLKTLTAVRQRGLNRPLVIIANTIKGKGVSFMENQPIWHVKSPTEEEIKKGLDELSA